jgi:serralysin
LTDVLLQRPGMGMIRLSGFENAIITGGSSANTFNLSNWNQAATLNGAGGDDKLIAAGNVNFTLTDQTLTRSTGGAIALTSIEQAELIGGAGNNTINAAAFTGRVKIDGAAGNDTITSGSGIALLLGGAGNDVINAGSGRSLMIGGLGLDRLTGGSNDDLLIDGQTVHDGNAAALDSLLAEWASSNSYLDRVAHLTGTSGGANGSTHLGGDNVIHDTAVDVLFGGDGDDLFFAKLDGTAATGKDTLSDKQTGEAAR